MIDRLDEYYLTVPIPDSISQHVDQEVQTLLDSTKIDLAIYNKKYFDEPNAYVLERKLASFLKTVMIARAQEDEATLKKLLKQAKETAK